MVALPATTPARMMRRWGSPESLLCRSGKHSRTSFAATIARPGHRNTRASGRRAAWAVWPKFGKVSYDYGHAKETFRSIHILLVLRSPGENVKLCRLPVTRSPRCRCSTRIGVSRPEGRRQNIFYRRLQRVNGPLTDDPIPILRCFKFANTYRASDRVSQFLIRNMIYRDDLPDDETNLFFRILRPA
jgi:alpha-glutamyl/putrescinyl thymine pyrophosphorylase clade 1